MKIRIDPCGAVRGIYSDELRDLLTEAGSFDLEIRRASHVEPSGNLWYIDLSPSGGPSLVGPYTARAAALRDELEWLEANLHDR